MQDKEIIKRAAEAIRIERLKRKLSQQELAELAGISTKYVNMLENQKSCPTIVVAAHICEALKVPLNRLLEEE